jgi:hypothetical protein
LGVRRRDSRGRRYSGPRGVVRGRYPRRRRRRDLEGRSREEAQFQERMEGGR